MAKRKNDEPVRYVPTQHNFVTMTVSQVKYLAMLENLRKAAGGGD